MSAPPTQSSVSISAVVSAGLASATAALLTSRFGVAGTIIGAAVTTMIITGGSAILKAYLESVSGKVRKVPGKVRERASFAREPREQNSANLPERPDLRDNFVGRWRAALGWFSNLSSVRKRYIFSAALLPAILAFLIGMGTVTSVELASGKSLSCSVWDNCPAASTTADGTSTGTRPSILGGRASASEVDEVQEQQGVDPAQEQQIPQDPGAQPAQPEQPGQPANPQQSAPPDSETPATPVPEEPASEEPAPEEPAAEEPLPEDPAVEEPPPEEQAPNEPPASEEPAPSDPADGAAQEPPSQP